jgi:UPF0609 protein C4orf27 homolog
VVHLLINPFVLPTLFFYSYTLLVKSGASKSQLKENAKIEVLRDKLKEFATNKTIDLSNRLLEKRKKKIVSKTFHGAGIVVPVKNDVGYRPLPQTDGNYF